MAQAEAVEAAVNRFNESLAEASNEHPQVALRLAVILAGINGASLDPNLRGKLADKFQPHPNTMPVDPPRLIEPASNAPHMLTHSSWELPSGPRFDNIWEQTNPRIRMYDGGMKAIDVFFIDLYGKFDEFSEYPTEDGETRIFVPGVVYRSPKGGGWIKKTLEAINEMVVSNPYATAKLGTLTRDVCLNPTTRLDWTPAFAWDNEHVSRGSFLVPNPPRVARWDVVAETCG